MSPDGTYTIAELADLADVTPRTVRYYVAQGLLPAPSGAGPGARYDESHLLRLLLIRRLQAAHQPLAEIRRRLAAMTAEEIEAVVVRPAEPVPGSALDYVDRLLGTRGLGETGGAWFALNAASPPPDRPASAALAVGSIVPLAPALAAASEPSQPLEKATERSQWDRIQLDPDIELHVRRPLSRIQNKRVERLLELARQILQEEET
jgi:DNA-binding transcriptional MerR regulator